MFTLTSLSWTTVVSESDGFTLDDEEKRGFLLVGDGW